MQNRRKLNLSWIVIIALGIGFIMLSLHTNQLMKQNNQLSNDVSNVEYLNASTQRLVRMVMGNAPDNRVMFYVGEQTRKYLDSDSSDRLYVVDMPEVRVIANDVIGNWLTLSNLFTIQGADAENTYDMDAICLAADNHFDGMTDLSIKITEAKKLLTTEIERTQMLSYGLLILIAFIALSNVISTSIAIKHSKELAVIASLDLATGLYNRSKCQEILKGAYVADRKQQPAVIVVDMNDLKKTNDLLGHRAGDEMIAKFANLLKQAANIHAVKPFLGRYGGDEFVIYHEDLEDEQEIATFIKELSFVTEDFNENGHTKYKISYAIGYAFHKEPENVLSVRQLFDEADEAMYTNKRKVKKLLETGAKNAQKGAC